MNLTYKWWTTVQKLHGKGAPSTGFGKLLKAYESAKTKAETTKTKENLILAETALTAVKTGRTKAMNLVKEKFGELHGDLVSLASHIVKAELELAEIGKEIG